jgi:hypothetical protein
MTTSPVFSTPSLGVAVGSSLALNGCSLSGNALCATGSITASGNLNSGTNTVTSNSSSSLAVGPNGATNPVFKVDSSTASQAAGLNITGAATGGTVAIAAIDSGANASLSINGKGSGTISIGNVSTGAITLTRATTLSAALTYGGVTLSNAVTGTGNMVLSNSPTFTGSASFSNIVATNPVAITTNSVSAFTVSQSANNALQVDTSAASQATGVKITGQGVGGGANIAAISTGSNEALTLNAKGVALVSIGNTSTGGVSLGAGGGGVSATNLTVNTSFTATGLVGYAALASGALASTSNYYAATANTLVPTSVIYPSEVTVTYGTTTSFDFDTFINAAVTLTGNITTNNVSNARAGKSGSITYIQDGVGGRTAVFNTIFKFAGGIVPVLSTAAGAIDVLFYTCRSATNCPASLNKDVK